MRTIITYQTKTGTKEIKKRRSKKDMTRKYDHCIGTTKYNEKENIPWHCHNIIYKERICTKEKNERKETSALRWQRVELYKQRSSPSASPQKSEKDLVDLITFFPNYLFIVVSKLIPKSQQKMGRMEFNIKSSRRNVRIRFRRFVRFNFFPFPFEQLYRLVTSMETGHSIYLETISFLLLYNSTSTCDMLYSCP